MNKFCLAKGVPRTAEYPHNLTLMQCCDSVSVECEEEIEDAGIQLAK